MITDPCVFVSYAIGDRANDWIDELICRVQEQVNRIDPTVKFEFFVDRESIRGGTDWRHALRAALARSRVFLPILSPGYLRSAWCLQEWQWWMEEEVHKQCVRTGVAPVYFATVALDDAGPGPARTKLMAEINSRQRYDFRQCSVRQLRGCDNVRIKGLICELAQQIFEVSHRMGVAKSSPTDLPDHNAFFIGRSQELADLRQSLLSGPVIVHGIGGLGKTELALAYGHAFAHEYPGGRFLLPAGGATTWDELLIRLCRRRQWLGDQPEGATEARFQLMVEQVHTWARTNGRCLIICDSVDNADVLHPGAVAELRQDSDLFHLLLTTQLRSAPGPSQQRVVWKPIQPLPPEDALSLLIRLTDAELPEDLSALEMISGALSGFTIAVELVGRLLAAEKAARGVPYQVTAEALRSQIAETLDEASTTYGKQLFRRAPEAGISIVVHRAVDHLSSVEFKVLGLLSQLAPDNAPLAVVKEALAVAVPEFQETRRFLLEIVFAIAVEHLMSLGLASRPNKPGASSIPLRELALDTKISLTVHPLVQAVVRRGPQSRDLCQAISDVLLRKVHEVAGHTSHPEHRWFQPATEAIAHSWLDRAAAGETKLAPAACEIGFAAGSALLEAGRWSAAASVLGRVVTLEESELIEDHPGMAMTHNALAVALSEMGRRNEAATHLKAAIGISRRFDNLEMEEKLSNNLASLTPRIDVPARRHDVEKADGTISKVPPDAAQLSVQAAQAAEEGDLSRAYETYERSLASLDDSDPEADAHFVLVSASMGTIASRQGRWNVAESHLRDAVKHGRSTLHLGDPRLLEARRSLARCLWDRGVSRDEVIQILREGLSDLQGREAEQPEMACDLLHELGLKLAALGLVEEGFERLSEAVRVARQYLGPSHRKVVLSLNNLGYAHLEGGRPKQALSVLLEAAELGNLLGPDDARLAAIIAGNIGKAYSRAGEAKSSVTYFERAIAAGGDSVQAPNGVEWHFLLAEALALSDQPTRAEKVLRELLDLLATMGEARGWLSARAFGNLAQLLGAFVGPSDEVVRYAQNAISIWASMHPVPIREIAQDLFVLGTTWAIREELPEAEDALGRALGHHFVMSFEAGQQHPLLEQVAGMFASVLQQQGVENAEVQKRISDMRESAMRMNVHCQP